MLYLGSYSEGYICSSLPACTPLVCPRLHGDRDGISLADCERPACYYQESVFILNQQWRQLENLGAGERCPGPERGYLGLGFIGDAGGPPSAASTLLFVPALSGAH